MAAEALASEGHRPCPRGFIRAASGVTVASSSPQARSTLSVRNNKARSLAALALFRRWPMSQPADDYGFAASTAFFAKSPCLALAQGSKVRPSSLRDEDVNVPTCRSAISCGSKTFIITADEANTYDLVNNNAVLMPADIAAHFGSCIKNDRPRDHHPSDRV